MSDEEREQRDEGLRGDDDAKEDLELTDVDADEVRGGAISKSPGGEDTDIFSKI